MKVFTQEDIKEGRIELKCDSLEYVCEALFKDRLSSSYQEPVNIFETNNEPINIFETNNGLLVFRFSFDEKLRRAYDVASPHSYLRFFVLGIKRHSLFKLVK